MSRKKKTPIQNVEKEPNRATIYVALIGLIGAVIVAVIGIINTRTQILLPVSLTQTAQFIEQARTPLANPPAQRPFTNGLLFAGQVVNPETGEWLNDRLVLIFLKDKEISRTVTSALNYQVGLPPYNQDGSSNSYTGTKGVVDGIFYLSVPNTYELTFSDLTAESYEFPFFEGRKVFDKSTYDVLATWMSPLNENTIQEFYVPSKNTRYSVFVFPGTISQLPRELQISGSVALLDGNKLIAIDPTGTQATPQPLAIADIIKFSNTKTENTVSNTSVSTLYNCSGTSEIWIEMKQTFVHTITDNSKGIFGVQIPNPDWKNIVPEIEKHYGIAENQIGFFSIKLIAPAGKDIEFTTRHVKTWESGTIIITRNGVEISAPYRIQVKETLELIKSEQKPCP